MKVLPGVVCLSSGVARDAALRAAVRRIPRGKVATYGQVAAAAGYPRYSRHVVQVLRKAGGALPWQRVLGAGGAIKLPGEAGREQRLLLEMEGVRFRGKRADLVAHQYTFPARHSTAAPAAARKPVRTRRRK
jgi:methylated-DNA-protein-cysteine methyltransferase-like protein